MSEFETHISYIKDGIDEIKETLNKVVDHNAKQDTKIALVEDNVERLKTDQESHKKTHWMWVPIVGGIMAIIMGFMRLVKLI